MAVRMRRICVFCMNTYHRHLSEPAQLMRVHGVKWVQADRQRSSVTAVGWETLSTINWEMPVASGPAMSSVHFPVKPMPGITAGSKESST